MPTIAELAAKLRSLSGPPDDEHAAVRDALAASIRAEATRAARAFGTNDSDADDIAQEVTLKVLDWLDTSEAPLKGTGVAFVRTCTRNLVITRARRHKPTEPIQPDAHDPADPEPGAEQRLETRDREVSLRRALTRLSDDDRELLQRVYLDSSPRRLQDLVDAEVAAGEPYPSDGARTRAAKTIRARYDKRLQRATGRLRDRWLEEMG